MSEQDGVRRAALADVAREMAKPRLAGSVRDAVEAAEDTDETPAPPALRGLRKS